MKKINVWYWIVTGLFAFVMLGSAIPDILVLPMAVQGFKEIGLPSCLVSFVGVAKALGVAAILIPGFPRIKEWAYAGLTFDLIGAVYLVAASGKPVATWAPMLILLVLAGAAYRVYHQRLVVRAAATRVQNATENTVAYSV